MTRARPSLFAAAVLLAASLLSCGGPAAPSGVSTECAAAFAASASTVAAGQGDDLEPAIWTCGSMAAFLAAWSANPQAHGTMTDPVTFVGGRCMDAAVAVSSLCQGLLSDATVSVPARVAIRGASEPGTCGEFRSLSESARVGRAMALLVAFRRLDGVAATPADALAASFASSIADQCAGGGTDCANPGLFCDSTPFGVAAAGIYTVRHDQLKH